MGHCNVLAPGEAPAVLSPHDCDGLMSHVGFGPGPAPKIGGIKQPSGLRARTWGGTLTTRETEAGAQVGQATWGLSLEVTLDTLWPCHPC